MCDLTDMGAQSNTSLAVLSRIIPIKKNQNGINCTMDPKLRTELMGEP